jgi:hypothetical protein
MNLFKITVVTLILSVGFLSGCANGYHPLGGLGLNLHNPVFWNAYNNAISTFEAQAEAGQITWVEAATKIRQADWNLATNAKQFDTSWKFDSNDEEFHQYSIALAERLDKRQMTVAQYKSMKLQKFNEVQQRQHIISNQNEQIQLLKENQRILENQSNRQPKQIKCHTYGNTTTCN